MSVLSSIFLVGFYFNNLKYSYVYLSFLLVYPYLSVCRVSTHPFLLVHLYLLSICVNIFSYKYVNLPPFFFKLISIVSLSSNHLSLYMQVPFNLYLMSFNLCTYEHVQQFFYCIFSTFSYKMFLLQVAVFLICMLLVAFVKMTTEKLPNIITFPQELDHHLSNYLIRWYLKKPLPNHLGNH